MGLKTRLAQDWEAGVFVGMGLNRDSSDADRLKGLDDIDYHATYGAFVEWRPGPYALGLAYRHAAHKGYGGVMELRASYLAWRDDSNALRVGVNAEWANGDAMQTWYGVTPGQAARSRAGLHAYSRLRASSRRRCMPPGRISCPRAGARSPRWAYRRCWATPATARWSSATAMCSAAWAWSTRSERVR